MLVVSTGDPGTCKTVSDLQAFSLKTDHVTHRERAAAAENDRSRVHRSLSVLDVGVSFAAGGCPTLTRHDLNEGEKLDLLV